MQTQTHKELFLICQVFKVCTCNVGYLQYSIMLLLFCHVTYHALLLCCALFRLYWCLCLRLLVPDVTEFQSIFRKLLEKEMNALVIYI